MMTGYKNFTWQKPNSYLKNLIQFRDIVESKERVKSLNKKIPNYSLSEHIRSLLVLDQREKIVDTRVTN